MKILIRFFWIGLMLDNIKLTILIPCLNEERTLGICIKKAQDYISKSNINSEILVADNGSTDRSPQIAEQMNVRSIKVLDKGYGSVLSAGIEASRGEYIIIGDADDTYDFLDLDKFVKKLEQGYDLVIGNRFAGNIEKGAMPLLHRYLGNPLLSGLGRFLFKTNCKDFHCGLRAFKKKSVQKLNLCCQGMEFASEMIVKASLDKELKLTEVPVNLYADRVGRISHLNTWSDGWRHLEFLLLLSPNFLFLYPGLIVLIFGLVGVGLTLISPFFNFDVQTLLISFIFVVIGVQSILLGIFANLIGVRLKIFSLNNFTKNFLNYLTLKSGMIISLVFFIMGFTLLVVATYKWYLTDFNELNPSASFRLTLPGSFLILSSFQVLVNSFFLSFIKLEYSSKTNTI